MKNSNTQLVSYTWHIIPVMGRATLQVKLNELNLVERGSTVDTQAGRDLSDSQLSQDVNEIIKEYENVFHGIRCLEGTYSIKIDPSVTPVVHPPFKIPFTQRGKGKENLTE